VSASGDWSKSLKDSQPHQAARHPSHLYGSLNSFLVERKERRVHEIWSNPSRKRDSILLIQSLGRVLPRRAAQIARRRGRPLREDNAGDRAAGPV
jgi:hypothetical protein